ncbi:serine/threonine protein kinase [Streptomyces sp. NBC_01565]|uniref:serine/threonine-protein kinase n=1 Tax=unclassified Streptomyces TaxID=2593676 RepID=UPI00225BBEC2|nr:serine/threonine protein kinase [Streptomyces sp. NBC_01565]MCX4545724.1 protein kinase [Streptomyces sp. NBC_01565]
MESLRAGDPTQVGPYRIAARLGSGGMGSVYLGRSRGGRSVAVKVIRPELAEEPEFRQRFAREVASARLVNGVYTAGVIDADPAGDPPWLATAYVAGPSLSEAVRDHGPWPEESVLALAAGVAEALEAIHAHGVIHRDLKPSNVLLSSDGPRVIDFGISAVAEAVTELTRAGTVIGTPGFMAPEQLTGGRVTDATDVFSLGAVLAFTATGTGPFGTGTAPGLMYRVVHDEPDLAGLPARLRDLVARCLAKDPARRPTVSALLDRLAGGPDAAGSPWPPAHLSRLLFPPAEPATPPTGPRAPVDPRTPVAGPNPDGLRAPADPRPPTTVDPAAPTSTVPPADRGHGAWAGPVPPPYPPVVTETLREYGPVTVPPAPRPRRGVLAAAGAAVAVVGLLAWLVPQAIDSGKTGATSSAASSSSSSTDDGQGAAAGTPSAAASSPDARAGSTRPPTTRAAVPPSASVSQPLPVVGSWQGTYLCGQGLTRLDLTITSPGGHALEAVFAFSAHPDNPGVPNGSFTMTGSFQNGRMTLRGDRWINQPPGYLMVDLEAGVTGPRPALISGAVISSVASCSQFMVSRRG